MDTRLDLAVHAIEEKEFTTARNLLRKLLSEDDKNEQAWYWMSRAVHTDRERRIYLKQALRINPKFTAAIEELESIGLAVPQITYLMRKLKIMGKDVRDDIITVEEAKIELLRYIRSKAND